MTRKKAGKYRKRTGIHRMTKQKARRRNLHNSLSKNVTHTF
jgi:hypothetical protein